MQKMKILLAGVLLSAMVSSCAFRSMSHAFGSYSEAEAFYEKGNYPKAIEKYQEYLAVNPQGNMAAMATYYIAKSYVAAKDKSKACEKFEQVVEQYPQTSWAAFAKDQLAVLREK